MKRGLLQRVGSPFLQPLLERREALASSNRPLDLCGSCVLDREICFNLFRVLEIIVYGAVDFPQRQ
jgi:hypothetical protein